MTSNVRELFQIFVERYNSLLITTISPFEVIDGFNEFTFAQAVNYIEVSISQCIINLVIYARSPTPNLLLLRLLLFEVLGFLADLEEILERR